MKMGYSRRVAAGAFSVGFAVSIHSERGLQAAEACVLCGANEFPDYLFDSLTGERWCGFGWFGTLAANGCFCGLKAALLFRARQRYGLVRTRNWNSRKKRKETQREAFARQPERTETVLTPAWSGGSLLRLFAFFAASSGVRIQGRGAAAAGGRRR